jgi:hypothetical protein
MKFFHGTISQFAEEIKTEGLIPDKKHRLIARLYNAAEDGYGVDIQRDDPIVHPHITTNQLVASEYAIFRAEYERAERGGYIQHIALNGTTGLPPAIKYTTERIPDAKPVVIELELPEDWPLFADRHDDRGCFYSRKSIPPDYVVKVTAVTA